MSYGFGYDPPKFPDALQNAQVCSLYSVTTVSVISVGLPQAGTGTGECKFSPHLQQENVKKEKKKKNKTPKKPHPAEEKTEKRQVYY